MLLKVTSAARAITHTNKNDVLLVFSGPGLTSEDLYKFAPLRSLVEAVCITKIMW